MLINLEQKKRIENVLDYYQNNEIDFNQCIYKILEILNVK